LKKNFFPEIGHKSGENWYLWAIVADAPD